MTGLFLADEACAGGDPPQAPTAHPNVHETVTLHEIVEARIQTFTETKGSCGFRKKPRQRHSNHRIGVSEHAWLFLSFHVHSLNATIWTREQRLKKANSYPSVGGGEAVNFHRNVRHTWSARRHARMRRETCKKP